MTYRVIQWSTGNVGRYALRGIIGQSDLELVGLWVHSEKKAGFDAAELCGLDAPSGVIATNDADALLALEADCVCYTATGDLRGPEALEDLVRIARAGKNIVSSSLVPLVWPAHVAVWAGPLEEACKEAGVSAFTSGIDPGFANDVLPLVLSGVAERIDIVRVQEILNYATYDQPEVLFETMGFAKPLDAQPVLLQPGVLSMAWGGTIKILAAGLGAELDRIDEWHERLPALETFEIPSGVVAEGTTAAMRFEVRGIVGGEPRIVLEHVTRLREDLAPEWPQPPGKGGYTVLIEGSPNIRLELSMEGDGGDENSAGLIVTAQRLLNAIPEVCEAPPGLLSALDVPFVTGRLT